MKPSKKEVKKLQKAAQNMIAASFKLVEAEPHIGAANNVLKDASPQLRPFAIHRALGEFLEHLEDTIKVEYPEFELGITLDV